MKIGPLDEYKLGPLIKVKKLLEEVVKQDNSNLSVTEEQKEDNILIQEIKKLIELIETNSPYMIHYDKQVLIEYLKNLILFLEDTEKEEKVEHTEKEEKGIEDTEEEEKVGINEMKENINEKIKELNELTKKTYLVLTDEQEKSLVDHKFIPNINETGSKQQFYSTLFDNITGNTKSTLNKYMEESKGTNTPSGSSNKDDYEAKGYAYGFDVTDIPVYLKTNGWFTSYFDEKHKKEISETLEGHTTDWGRKAGDKDNFDISAKRIPLTIDCNPFKLIDPCYSLKVTFNKDIYYDKTPSLGIDISESEGSEGELTFKLYGNDYTEEQRKNLFMFPNYYFLDLKDAAGHDARIATEESYCAREALTGAHVNTTKGGKSKKRKVKRTKRNKNIKKKTIKKKINRKTRKLV